MYIFETSSILFCLTISSINRIMVFIIVMMQIRRQCIVEFGRAATQGCYAVCPPDLFIGAAIYRLAIVVLDVMVGTLACLRAHTYIMSQEAKEGKYINMWYICGCR